MSSFWKIGKVSEGLTKLASDLDSGAWAQRYGEWLDRAACDLGYRLVTTK